MKLVCVEDYPHDRELLELNLREVWPAVEI